MKKILREIFSVQNINNHKVISILGIKIKFALCRGGGEYSNLISKEGAKASIIQEVDSIITKKMSVLEGKLRKITPKAYLERFEIHVTDHCNLNCKACSHWAPLAEEFYISIEDFTKDLTRMKELTKGNIGRILLLGGEPLLHPQLLELIEITSDLFPKTEIAILTNGILVNKMDEKFWQVLVDKKVTVETTKYPINVDYEAIKNKCEKLGLRYLTVSVKEGIKWDKKPMDLKGKQDPITNFLNCWPANRCITLKEGKLYTCVRIPHVNHFNKYFNQNLEVTERDYIDIYKTNSLDEILTFLAKPVPFCRYCGMTKITRGYWEPTKKDICEWV